MIIRIADLDIDWGFKRDGFTELFEVGNSDAAVINFSQSSQMSECHGIQYVHSPTNHILQHCRASAEILCANDDWSDAVIYSGNYTDADYSLPLAAICSRFACFDTIFLHGSFVDYDGNGIVFAGYSGVGKTTQAQLWNKYSDAEIVNGDKVFLRIINDKVFAFGSPWKGSSEYCLNKKVSLKSVVILKQAKENKIKRLNTIECIEHFLPHVFLPHWDEKNMVKALDTFNNILEKVPVWLLECRPDEDAVKLTKDTIFNK
ncbi:MAG: hypothetical protein IJ025_09110 [Clostridia bacterium]|nr:hypothetical protein [Clostridia bacterium]